MCDDTKASQGNDTHSLDLEIDKAIEFTAKQMKASVKPNERKAFVEIHSRLLDIKEALASGCDNYKKYSIKILASLQLIDENLKNDAVWDVSDSLKELLPLIASEDWVYRALLAEKYPSKKERNRWKDIDPDHGLDKLIKKYKEENSNKDMEVARQTLATLFSLRNNEGRHIRARESLRALYLRQMTLVLALLLIFSILSWLQLLLFSKLAIDQAALVVAFFTGGLGAVISGTIRIRDVARIAQIDSVWRTMSTQIVLGGTLAVIVLVILQTGLIKLGSVDFAKLNDGSSHSVPALVYLVGFVSGYSEPFALGFLKKIIELGK